MCNFKFQLVHQCKLLGSVIDATASLGPEISGGQLAITKISAPYHEYIGTEAKLTLHRCVNCINSMLVSSLLSNVHTWCNMSESQLSQIDSRLATAYGACIPYKVTYSSSNDKIRRLPDKHILSTTRVPDAYRQLRYCRCSSAQITEGSL